MTKKRKITLGVLSLLLSLVLAISIAMIGIELCDQQKEKEVFDNLAILITPIEESEPPFTSPDEQVTEEESVADETEPIQQSRNLAPLFEQNSDCTGWICIPGTAIDYPVMHTPDQPQKYLRLDFGGSYSSSGVPFLDWRCTLDSDNLIVYGHNMKNGTMFAGLRNYLSADYRTANPMIEFETQAGLKTYAVFAVVKVKKTDDWYSFISVGNAESFSSAVAAIQSRALYNTGITPEYGQQLLTLSTCYGSGKDGRLIVIGAEM